MVSDNITALQRGTNLEDNLPRCFDHFVSMDLGVVDIN